MEKWDAYNSSLEKIDGMILIRGEEKSIPSGIYHLVCDILVQHTDSSILLMQRDFKKHYGGMWEASAGGSALISGVKQLGIQSAKPHAKQHGDLFNV